MTDDNAVMYFVTEITYIMPFTGSYYRIDTNGNYCNYANFMMPNLIIIIKMIIIY